MHRFPHGCSTDNIFDADLPMQTTGRPWVETSIPPFWIVLSQKRPVDLWIWDMISVKQSPTFRFCFRQKIIQISKSWIFTMWPVDQGPNRKLHWSPTNPILGILGILSPRRRLVSQAIFVGAGRKGAPQHPFCPSCYGSVATHCNRWWCGNWVELMDTPPDTRCQSPSWRAR